VYGKSILDLAVHQFPQKSSYSPKTNMEPENHPFEKENHLNLTSIMMFQCFQGVSEVAACLTTMRYPKKNRTAEKTDATSENSVLAEFHIVLLDHQVCHRQHH